MRLRSAFFPKNFVAEHGIVEVLFSIILPRSVCTIQCDLSHALLKIATLFYFTEIILRSC